MMSEWKEVKLEDITIRIGDGLHGTPEYDSEGEYYFINGNNLKDGKILIKNDTKKVTKEVAKKHEKPLSEKTILLAINGTIGNLAFYNSEKCMLGKSACYINITDQTDVQFMYYHFLNEDFQFYLEMIATGTTIPNVPLKEIRKYTFNLPPLPEQRAIASVLSSLDDKIDMLHRQNQTLEQMAETLFRQWFVVEADEGWKEGVLGDLVDVKYGKDHKKLADGQIPVYGSGGLMRKVNKSIFEGESVLIPRKGSLNNVMYVDEPFWTVDTMFYTVMKKSNLAKFIYQFIKKKDLSSMNVGSAVPSMTTKVLNNMPIGIPPDDVVSEFEKMVSPFYNKIKTNKTQIRTLTALRDALLPKLMSGEVRIINELFIENEPIK
ncbi:MAG: restriction endonuclease subunit S [Chitinophagaceae bacterium]|nr:MAG: restriction endonuclease subunit S [Chitinophagaceae bacterium]